MSEYLGLNNNYMDQEPLNPSGTPTFIPGLSLE